MSVVTSHWARDNKKARNKHPKMCFSPRFVVPYREGNWNVSWCKEPQIMWVGDGLCQYGCNCLLKRLVQGWGGSLISKVFVLQALGPKFEPQSQQQKAERRGVHLFHQHRGDGDRQIPRTPWSASIAYLVSCRD